MSLEYQYDTAATIQEAQGNNVPVVASLGDGTDKIYTILEDGTIVNRLQSASKVTGKKVWVGIPNGFAKTDLPELDIVLYRALKSEVQDPAKRDQYYNDQDQIIIGTEDSKWEKVGEIPKLAKQYLVNSFMIQYTGVSKSDGTSEETINHTYDAKGKPSTSGAQSLLLRYDEDGNEYIYAISEAIDRTYENMEIAYKSVPGTTNGFAITNEYIGGEPENKKEVKTDKTWVFPKDWSRDEIARFVKYAKLTFTLYWQYTKKNEDGTSGELSERIPVVLTEYSNKIVLDCNKLSIGATQDDEGHYKVIMDDQEVGSLYQDEEQKWFLVISNQIVFSNLPLYAPNGTEYIYDIEETQSPYQYNAQGELVKTTAYSVTKEPEMYTNVYNPETISLEGTKTWLDKKNAMNTRPDNLTLQIYRRANATEAGNKYEAYLMGTITSGPGQTQVYKKGEDGTSVGLPNSEDPEITWTLAADGKTWSYTITKLDKYAPTGAEWDYKIVEVTEKKDNKDCITGKNNAVYESQTVYSSISSDSGWSSKGNLKGFENTLLYQGEITVSKTWKFPKNWTEDEIREKISQYPNLTFTLWRKLENEDDTALTAVGQKTLSTCDIIEIKEEGDNRSVKINTKIAFDHVEVTAEDGSQMSEPLDSHNEEGVKYIYLISETAPEAVQDMYTVQTAGNQNVDLTNVVKSRTGHGADAVSGILTPKITYNGEDTEVYWPAYSNTTPTDPAYVNVFTPEPVKVTGTKTWTDNKNAYNTRPENLTLSVYRSLDASLEGELIYTGNGTSATYPVTTTPENTLLENVNQIQLTWSKSDSSWTYIISGLDQCDINGNIWYYTVKEEYQTVDGVNRLTGSYEYYVADTSRTEALKADKTETQGENKFTTNLVNRLDEKGKITLDKNWNWPECWNADSSQIKYPVLTFTLMRYLPDSDKESAETIKTLTVDYNTETAEAIAQKLANTFTDLNVFNPEGMKYLYSIIESNSNGYLSTISPEGGILTPEVKKNDSTLWPIIEDTTIKDTKATYTNQYDPSFITLNGTKEWVDYCNKMNTRPDDLTIKVYRCTTGDVTPNVASELLFTAVGNTITENSEVLKNKNTLSVSWTKDSDNKGTTWSYTISGLDEYASNGKKWEYQVVEVPAEGKTGQIAGTNSSYTINNGTTKWRDKDNTNFDALKNSLNVTSRMTVSKNWVIPRDWAVIDDQGNVTGLKEGIAYPKLKLSLYKSDDMEQAIETKELACTAAMVDEYLISGDTVTIIFKEEISFNDQLACGSDGTVYQYYVAELIGSSVEGYAGSTAEPAQDQEITVNAGTGERVAAISGAITPTVWSTTVNGEKKQIWPLTDDTTSSVTAVMTNTFKITDTITLNGTKQWVDFNNMFNTRPDTVTVEVYRKATAQDSENISEQKFFTASGRKEGSGTGDIFESNITFNDAVIDNYVEKANIKVVWNKNTDNTWSYTISGLDRYAPNGREWQYYVKEVANNDQCQLVKL